jgi:hypothetical protein
MTEDERKNWICFADLNCGETPRYDKAMEGIDFKNIRLESARKHHFYPATGLQHLVATDIDAVRPARHEILVKSHEPPTLKRKGANSYLWQKKKVSEVSGLL